MTLRLFFLFGLAAGCSGGVAGPGALPDIGEELPAATRAVLEAAEKFEIMALDPDPRREKDPETPSLGDYRILSRASLPEPSARHESLSLIYRGILSSDGRVAACFNPRHGVRATQGKEVVELIICYECLSMKVHHQGNPAKSILTSKSVEPAVTQIWNRHGLEIHGK